MKKTNIKLLCLLLVAPLIITNSGCKKFIDPKINIDPNTPPDAPMSTLLPSIEEGLAYSTGSDLGRFTSLWIQTQAGLANQHLQYDGYNITEADVNNMWYFNLYGGTMKDLDILIKKADAQNSPYYGGIGRILMAYSLGICTDLWGDIPYSEAFRGQEIQNPKYDSQQEIYTSIQTLLTQGIANLNETGTFRYYPGADDAIFGGDNASWIKAANSLSARYYLHLGKKDATNYTKALTALSAAGGVLGANADDLQLTFGASENNGNPWYLFYENRYGDIGMGSYLVELMKDTTGTKPVDPRLSAYCDAPVQFGPSATPIDIPRSAPWGILTVAAGDSVIDYFGSPAGDGFSPVSNMGTYYASINSIVPMISYVEVKFIEAEASFNTGATAAAATAYNDAVTASLAKFNATDAAYLAAVANETGASITLAKIMTQKYIAMYSQGIEGFCDWRRTNIPALTAASNNITSGVIARRFPYPQSERVSNTNFPKTTPAGVTDKVWWDQ